MSEITVITKEELAKAKNDKIDEIIVTGELAKHVHNGRKIFLVGKVGLALVILAIAPIPILGPMYGVAAVHKIAVLGGVEIVAIIGAIAVGLALLLAIYEGYDEIEYFPPQGPLRLKRKSK